MELKVGVIGTAGDLYGKDGLSARLFDKMVETVRSSLSGIDGVRDVVLVSGGSAWSDHVAVRLFLDGTVSRLDLFLPCAWDSDSRRFADNGLGKDWRTNPGYLINGLHDSFSKRTGVGTLGEIDDALKKEGCRHVVRKGFHERNKDVAKVDVMIAFCFGKVCGGTKNTYDLCRAKKVFVDLEELDKGN